jgi:hypothetical protein
MSLTPSFSLSPLSPSAYTYDPANPNLPFFKSRVSTYGVVQIWVGPSSLQEAYSNNHALLAYDPVPDTEQTINDLANDVYRRCAVGLAFAGFNVSTANQYLLVFRLQGLGSPVVQFFVGSSLVRVETPTQSPEDIAILLDTPGNGTSVYVTVRLAENDNYFGHGFFFKGVDCYLL